MAVPSLEQHREDQTDRQPLLMEHQEDHNREHIIEIARGADASSSSSSGCDPPSLDPLMREDRPSSSTLVPISQSFSSSSNGLNSRNTSLRRRGDGYVRHRRSPLNSMLWISIELVVTVSQIIASIVVLSLSRDENPQAPLFAWIVGYASGCVATLPLLYWRYLHRNSRGTQHDSAQPRQGSSQSNPPSEPIPYRANSVSRASEEESNTGTATRNGQNVASPTARLERTVL